MNALLKLLFAVLFTAASASHAADDAQNFVVIAHASVGRVDASALQRLYTGRAIEVGGVVVLVANAAPGSAVRERFLSQVVKLDSDRYVAYWTVRRHVGKGVPPHDLRTTSEMIDFVQNTPGGLGYIAVADLRPGLNVVYRP